MLHVAGVLLGWAIWMVLTLVWGVLVIPVTLLLRPVWPGVLDRHAALTRATLHLYVSHLTFVQFRVENADKRLEGPRILVANHQSRLDSPVMLSIEPRLFGPVRGYMLRVPIIGMISVSSNVNEIFAGDGIVPEHAMRSEICPTAP